MIWSPHLLCGNNHPPHCGFALVLANMSSSRVLWTALLFSHVIDAWGVTFPFISVCDGYRLGNMRNLCVRTDKSSQVVVTVGAQWKQKVYRITQQCSLFQQKVYRITQQCSLFQKKVYRRFSGMVLRDRNRRPEGGEWEPIKISSEIDPSAYIPKSPQALKSSRWSLE